MPSQGDFAKAKDKRGYMKLIYILYLQESCGSRGERMEARFFRRKEKTEAY
jgi:hypothetical protein